MQKKCAHTKKLKKCSQKNVCTHRSLKSGYKTSKSDYKKLKIASKNLKGYCKIFLYFSPQQRTIKECSKLTNKMQV